jgi:hypothetical protein
MNVHLTPVSSNAKTGPIPVSTSSMETCPDACPFKAGACYASGGPLLLHWRKVSKGERGDNFSDFLSAVRKFRPGQLWRHNQAGDLAGANNTIDVNSLKQLVEANKGKKGFTYTHKPVLDRQGDSAASNREAVKFANENGFTVNLSANNLSHADELLKLGVGPVCAVVPMDVEKNTVTPAGNRVVVCPAAVRDGVSCATCKLCSFAKRQYVIAFPAHGVKKKALSAMVTEKQAMPLAA